MVLWSLTALEWLAGHWSLALEHAGAAYELTEQTQHAHARHWVGRAKALLEADLGLVEEARASADEVLALAQDVAYEIFAIETIGVLGRLELELGDLESAGDHLRDLPGRLLAGGIHDPALPVWADSIETLVGLGEVDRAHDVPRAVRAARRPPGSPSHEPGPPVAAGCSWAAEGDLAGALSAFERSLADAAPFPLERGRRCSVWGVVRRQAQKKRAAREALDEALATFEGLGAQLWAEKARADQADQRAPRVVR